MMQLHKSYACLSWDLCSVAMGDMHGMDKHKTRLFPRRWIWFGLDKPPYDVVDIDNFLRLDDDGDDMTELDGCCSLNETTERQ